MGKHWWLILGLGMALPGWGQGNGPVDTGLRCDETGSNCQGVSARVEFPNGPAADLFLSFEGATDLEPDSLEITADLVDPRDPQLRNRLPRGTFIPSDFPVLIQIDPSQECRLSFRGRWSLELVTDNLEFTSHTPLRLFRAPNGGSFQDISFGLGSGSLRLRAAGADFSEFLVVSDLRPMDAVVGGKFDRLDGILEAGAGVLPLVAGLLQNAVDDARQAFESGDTSLAIARVTALINLVRDNAGTAIPDLSEPGQTTGVAGLLRSAAVTLRHSLVLDLQAEQQGSSGLTQEIRVDPEHSLELSVSFTESFVVDPEDLDIEAEIIPNVHDPAFLARLPPGVHVPEEFPVLVRINADSMVDQAFSGMFEIELVTDSLNFVGGTPLRLFKAPDGGAFEDITSSLGLGSLRLRGAGADFSEFVIASDLRPMTDVIARKLARLEGVLQDESDAIDPAVLQQLHSLLDQVGQSIENGAGAQALLQLDQFIEDVRSNSGEDIPSLWRSSEASVNVAGELSSLANSLHFSLGLQESPITADPADVNLDGVVDVGDVLHLIDRVFSQP